MNRTIFRNAFLVSTVFLGTAFPVAAEKMTTLPAIIPAVPADQQNCKMVESVNVSLSFGNVPVALEEIKAKVDGLLAEVNALGKDAGIESLTIQNMNYSIYGTSNGYPVAANTGAVYTLSGSFTLQIDSAEKATALMKVLSGKSFVPNMNVNSYRQCQ